MEREKSHHNKYLKLIILLLGVFCRSAVDLNTTLTKVQSADKWIFKIYDSYVSMHILPKRVTDGKLKGFNKECWGPKKVSHFLSHNFFNPPPTVLLFYLRQKHIHVEGGSTLKCQLKVFCLKRHLRVCNLILLIYCESKKLLHFDFSNWLACSISQYTRCYWSPTVHPLFIPFHVLTQTSSVDLRLHQLCDLALFPISCSVVSEKEPTGTGATLQLSSRSSDYDSHCPSPPSPVLPIHYCQTPAQISCLWDFLTEIWRAGRRYYKRWLVVPVGCSPHVKTPRWNSEIENTPLVPPWHSAALGCKSTT